MMTVGLSLERNEQQETVKLEVRSNNLGTDKRKRKETYCSHVNTNVQIV